MGKFFTSIASGGMFAAETVPARANRRKEKLRMDISILFLKPPGDLNNLSLYKRRNVTNMVIKAFNSEIFSEKHLFKLYIIEYF